MMDKHKVYTVSINKNIEQLIKIREWNAFKEDFTFFSMQTPFQYCTPVTSDEYS